MLETLRNNSRNIAIYAIFGVLILVFILSFGPQAGAGGGCSTPTTYVARVAGEEVSEASWRYGVLGTRQKVEGAQARAMRGRERTMDALLARELLAQAAEARGFRISDEEVDERIATGKILILGTPQPGEYIYFQDGVFDYATLEAFVRGSLNMPSVDAFREQQRKELLAQKMRDTIAGAVRVSPDEALAEFRKEQTRAELEFVKFETDAIAETLEVTPADLQAFAAARAEELKKAYEARKGDFREGETAVRVRQIFVPSERKQAGETPPTEPTAASDMPDAKRAEIEALLARVRGGEAFAKVARDAGDPSGGLRPWGPASALGPELAEPAKSLPVGQVSDVIEAPQGYYLLLVEGRAEGVPTFEQLQPELAEEIYRSEKAKELARAYAEATLKAAQAGTPLERQFAREGEEAAAPAAPPTPPTVPGAPAFELPRLRTTGSMKPFGNEIMGEGRTSRVGTSAELARAVWKDLAPGALGPKVYELEDGFAVVKLVSRTEPDLAAFEKKKGELLADLALQKSYDVVDEWIGRRCAEARDGGELEVNRAYVDYQDIDEKTGKVRPTAYRPCAFLGASEPTIMLP